MPRSLRFAICVSIVLASAPTGAQPPCPGDCNGDGDLTASDVARLNALIVRCSPCNGRPGGVAAGCAAQPGGCVGADLNGDLCFRASELAFLLREITKPVAPPPQPGACRIDAASYPHRPSFLPCRLDCNADGRVGASDQGRLQSLRSQCPTCADGSAGAPPDGCPAQPIGCPVADVDFDGCIRAGEEQAICSPLL